MFQKEKVSSDDVAVKSMLISDTHSDITLLLFNITMEKIVHLLR